MLTFLLPLRAQDCKSLERVFKEVAYADRPQGVDLFPFEMERIEGLENLDIKLKKEGCQTLRSALMREKGKAYHSLGRYAESLEAHMNSFEIAQQAEAPVYQASAANQIAKHFLRDGRADSAVHYFKTALDLYSAHGVTRGEYIALPNIAETYLSMKEYDSARIYTDRLMALPAEILSLEDTLFAEQMQLHIALRSNGPDVPTLEALAACAERFIEAGDPESACGIYENIGGGYAQLKDYASAVKYYTMAKDAPCDQIDFYHLQVLTDRISGLSILQRAENERLELEKRDQARLLAVGSVLLVFLLIISYLLVKNRTQRAHLAEQELIQSHQRQELALVESLMEGQESERKRIAEELHDRLGGLIAASKMYISTVEQQALIQDEEIQQKLKTAGNIIDRTANEVRRISHNLYSKVLEEYGLKTALEQMQEYYAEMKQPHIDWHLELPDERFDLDLEANAYRIVQEALANSIKHAQCEHLTVQVRKDDEELLIMIEDDGKGFDPQATENMGIGLKNLFTRTERMAGELSIDSKPAHGTSIICRIPLKT